MTEPADLPALLTGDQDPTVSQMQAAARQKGLRLRFELVEEEPPPGRTPLDELTSDALDQLYRRIEDAEAKRDAWHDWADTFAYKVAPAEVLGRHDEDGRFPWSDALDMLTPAAEVDQLRQRAERAEAAIERVRKVLAERHAEIADYEAENKPAPWSDAAANTCSRIEDALREFPEPQGIRAALDPQEPQP